MNVTLGQVLREAATRFEAAGIDAPKLTAELLMAHMLGLSRAGVAARMNEPLTGGDVKTYEEYVSRRESREPLEYITGRCEFLGRMFRVGPEVLVPRPETELLAMQAGAYLKAAKEGGAVDLAAADICTGSGCIAITLALDVPGIRVRATDISPGALRLAALNAELLGAAGSVELFEGDLLSPLAGTLHGGYDIIVSNPPYIPSGTLEGLQEEVRREPVLALDGGTDGLDFIRRIIEGAPSLLKPGGRLMMEIGLGQSGVVGDIINRTADLELVGFIKDHAGIERIVVCVAV